MANERVITPKIAPIFLPILKPMRYKGLHGGRGGGKSWVFASMMVAHHIAEKTDSVCLREVLKSLKFSSKKLIEQTIESLNAGDCFEVLDSVIKAKNGGIIIFDGMADHTADSIKSLEGFDRCWFEEAQNASQHSLNLLRPTIRKDNSELWFSWNRYKEDDPIELLLCGENAMPDSIVIEANIDDLPKQWQPQVLINEREADRKIHDQDTFDNIWKGKYLKNSQGDYFKHQIAKVNEENRVCFIPRMGIPVNTFWDIGNSDGCAIWYHQQVGLEDRFIGYYEGHGEDLEHYYKELQDRGFVYNKHFLPHDADHARLSVKNKSVATMLKDLGCQNVQIVPRIADLNTGILQTRKHFASAWFDSDADGKNGVKLGLKRLTNYRKRYNQADNRWIDEPDKKNGCSEGADAFRQWAQAKEGGNVTMAGRRAPQQADSGAYSGWMG